MKLSQLLKMFLSLALFVSAGAMTADAQTEEGASQAEGDDKKAKEPEEVGTGRTSTFGETLTNFWSVRTAFQATQTYDDNVFLANQFRKGDLVTKVAGRVSVAYLGRHTRFEAGYMPEYSIYQRYEPLNAIHHTYFHTFTRQATRKLEIHWRAQAYRMPSRGALPFKVTNFGGFTFMKYSLDALQDGLNITGGSTVVGVTYRFNPRWKMTADVDGAATSFTERGSPTTPVVTQEMIFSAGARVNLAYEMTPRRSIGVRVSNTYFGFVGPSQHQHYQSIQATFEQRLPRHYTLSVGAGPGFSQSQGSSGLETTTFFNVNLERNLPGQGFGFTFQRAAQVGVLQGSILSYSGSARVHRNFGRRWISNIGASYTRSQGASGRNELELASGTAQVGYRLTRMIIPFVNYGYTHQKNLGSLTNARNVSRNQVAIGLVFNPGSILGR